MNLGIACNQILCYLQVWELCSLRVIMTQVFSLWVKFFLLNAHICILVIAIIIIFLNIKKKM